MLPVTAFFAAILGLMYVALSVFVIKGRVKHQVGLGDGGHSDMQRRIRAHANFAEYVPFALILLALNEMRSLPQWALMLLGFTLLLGRVLHAYSLTRAEVTSGKIMFRQIGMASTFAVLIILSLLLLA
ncbi:MAG: hypothetical protein EBR02_04075 [Alphaproteobacteria bacterium]|nr:hypothetical protein [Alphaproteobacteria bacterium]